MSSRPESYSSSYNKRVVMVEMATVLWLLGVIRNTGLQERVAPESIQDN